MDGGGGCPFGFKDLQAVGTQGTSVRYESILHHE
jgi:hypothetical protein